MLVTFDIDRLGQLVSTIGSPLFGARYFDLFCNGLEIDQCTVFAFRHTLPPDPIVLEGGSAKMREVAHTLANEYIAGAFTQDPNVLRARESDKATVHCLRADQVTDRDYRMRFYERPCLAHELVMLGQAQDTLYYSSFYRSDRCAAFQPAEVERVASLAGFAVKTLHRHLELLGGHGGRHGKPPVSDETSASADRRRRTAAHLRDVLLAEPYALSPREAEVCAGIILGYTTLGISLNFGISINTVATHRKRAYRKLGICSQNELFSRYFQLVNQQPDQLSLARMA